jgi:hypothetical protein
VNESRITTEKVMDVYSGINGKCCCGCSGRYYYASDSVESGSKKRGYAVDENEVSDRMVKKVVGIINAAPSVEFSSEYFSTVVGNRLYIAYLK